jgi:hypothetical protein
VIEEGVLFGTAVGGAQAQRPAASPVLEAKQDELERSFAALKSNLRRPVAALCE